MPKIKNLKNHIGNSLNEWIIQEETKDYFILRESNGSKIFNYPRASFESDKEHFGASRDGNRLLIPERHTK
jgi:hypothetical protein